MLIWADDKKQHVSTEESLHFVTEEMLLPDMAIGLYGYANSGHWQFPDVTVYPTCQGAPDALIRKTENGLQVLARRALNENPTGFGDMYVWQYRTHDTDS